MNEIVIIQEKNKFKDNAVGVTIPLSLDETITDYNLISQILKLGCEKYKTSKEIWTHLQDLYGAAFEILVSKIGEKLVICFYIQFIENKYALFGEDVLKEAVKFLNEIINKPLIVNNRFREGYFNTEKENLEVLIKSRVDDKDEYAVDRAIELCCEGEPYALFRHGDLERLRLIKNEELWQLWQKTLKHNSKTFYLCGNFETAYSKKLIDTYFNEANYIIEKNSSTNKVHGKITSKEVIEQSRVNQGKLCMCYRTNGNIVDGSFPALAILNSLIGGGMHSKLFREVREKNGLAYYCYSFIDKFKGLLVISAGIDFNNYSKAKDIIFKQIHNIKVGKISKEEFNSSKNNVISGLEKIQDSQFMLINHLFSLKTYGINISLEEMIQMINKVSLDQVVNAAAKLELNIIYFLRNE
ncbi:MAG: pitrilysin family protein [Bacillota bacterium]|nr:pitrilysin family protein [Bacillota bacterium]